MSSTESNKAIAEKIASFLGPMQHRLPGNVDLVISRRLAEKVDFVVARINAAAEEEKAKKSELEEAIRSLRVE